MSSRRKTSGLQFYALLRKEVNDANRKLTKPLTKRETDAVLKNRIFPHYQGKSYSRIKKGELRSYIDKSLKTKARKKTAGGQVYNRILHEVSEVNKLVSENQRLTLDERRKLISEDLYPKYKGKPARGIDWTKVKQEIAAYFRKLRKDICDVLSIPENSYQAINYFDIDDFLGNILPPCIFVEVVAGKYGRTIIFNTKEYNYYESGAQQITNNINAAVRNGEIRGGTNDIPVYVGEPQLRPNKKNDGNPENYYLKLVLAISEIPVEESDLLKIPKRKKTTKKKKATKQRMTSYILERTKKLSTQKSKVKPIRQKLSQRINDARFERRALQRLIKSKALPKKYLKTWAENSFKEEKQKLDRLKRKGTLKKYQYDELLKMIKNAFKKRS